MKTKNLEVQHLIDIDNRAAAAVRRLIGVNSTVRIYV